MSPSNVLGTNTAEAFVENYAGNYEQATGATAAASFAGSTTSSNNPPAYPKDNLKTALYFPFPTASGGDAFVGYSYAYFYTCYPTRDKDQEAAIKKLFTCETASSTAGTAATVATFWNLDAMGSPELKNLTSALNVLKTAAVTTPTNYYSPVDGSIKKYTCTDN